MVSCQHIGQHLYCPLLYHRIHCLLVLLGIISYGLNHVDDTLRVVVQEVGAQRRHEPASLYPPSAC